MAQVKNILFIMADQLRADYLSCYGHKRLKTPAIDALARKGVLFTNAYVNATVCGPSRMSYYTGRTMTSHGSTWNNVPLRAGEPTLGDYLRPLGMRVALAGKTHMAADYEGLDRMGVSFRSIEGILASECGFEPYERDDGLHPDEGYNPGLSYNNYLREKGYLEANPWHSAANAGEASDGSLLSGWLLSNARQKARVAEEHSETPYMTDRAIEFMRACGDTPWLLHLSYIKPHWPFIAPAPYHDMYGPEDVLPVNRSQRELKNPHPVYAAYTQHSESVAFADDEVRRTVIPTYMGLIRQIDDHLKRLFAFMKAEKLMDNTMIVFCSDHGDYLGDHWLGEKELFHEPVVRTPLIVYDPDKAANGTRGKVERALVQAIDLAPTFLDALRGPNLDHILEGRSLVPYLRGGKTQRHEAIVSELDYMFRPARYLLGVAPDKARAWMVRSKKWKYVHYEGFRPQLFDLANDPQELVDRGADPKLGKVRAEHRDLLFEWSLNRKTRITVPNPPPSKRRRRRKGERLPGDYYRRMIDGSRW
jgi:arylsulfatase A-like enzyme